MAAPLCNYPLPVNNGASALSDSLMKMKLFNKVWLLISSSSRITPFLTSSLAGRKIDDLVSSAHWFT